MFQTDLLIDGKFVAGQGAEETVVNPATGAAARQGARSQRRAGRPGGGGGRQRAFKSWGQTTPQERSLLLLKLADRIEQEAGAFAELESLNCGKPRVRVLNDEMPAIVDCFRFFAVRRAACRAATRTSICPTTPA